MEFDFSALEKALASTGLPFRSKYFIHGLAACSETGPEGFDFEMQCALAITGRDDSRVRSEDELREEVAGLFSAALEDAYIELIEGIFNSLEENAFGLQLNPADPDDISSPSLKEWCTGFLAGVRFMHDKWSDEDSAEDVMPLLFPLMRISDADKFRDSYPDEAEKTDVLLTRKGPVAAINEAVLEIYEYWLDRAWSDDKWDESWEDPDAEGWDRSPEPVKSDKIGRNEPCPCGSGRKYKKCCGK